MQSRPAHLLQAFLPRSRCLAIARNEVLPELSEGACLSADISGFTPMAEALRDRLGSRQGAEALTQLLNQVFEALIAVVHKHAGDVMGFAGDSISIFFETSAKVFTQIPLLALNCAMSMQNELNRFTAHATLDGKVPALSMKIGLSYGQVHRLLVGQPGEGLFDLITGASLDRMVAAEQLAEKGEILCAPEYLALLGNSVDWGAPRDGYLPVIALKAPITELPTEPAVPDLSSEILRAYFPPDLYASLVAAPEGFQAELRPVVSAFVHFEGIDYEHDPAATEKLDAYVRLAQHLVRQYGGNLIRLDYGDKGSVLHVIFGAPTAHEDDEARAVGWALDMQSKVHSADERFAFISAQMIGMACGQVYAGVMGAPSRRSYTLMGDEVNASARLMQACHPWQILVSQPIMLAAQKRFMFHQFPGFQVKGKYEAVPVAMPVAPMPAMPAIPATPLVGRSAELDCLDETLDDLFRGINHVLRIEGVAGAGKSRLVAELLQHAVSRGVRTLTGNGQSAGHGVPYLAWREIIRNIFGLQEAWPVQQQSMQIQNMLQWINSEWIQRLPLLGDLLGLDIPETPLTSHLDANLRQQSLFSLLSDLLSRIALQQPVIIVIEDCHWLDNASICLFESLARSLEPARVVMIATHRPPLDPDHQLLPGLEHLPRCRHLSLNELSPEATRLLVTTRLGGELPEAIMALILERAQGNPFFIIELAETIRETSRLKMENGRWVLESVGEIPQLPETIHKVVLARLDRLDEPERTTLKVSSVVGRRFPLRLVRGIHPGHPTFEILVSQLDRLEKRDFVQREQLEPEQVNQFKHNITQEVAYETLLFAQRRELHQAAASWIETTYADSLTAHYTSLVYHYHRAEDFAREREYARLAGFQSSQKYANTEALLYISRALELTPAEDLTERFELLAAREEIYKLLAQRVAQQADLALLYELASELDEINYTTIYRYRVALKQGYLAEVTADFPMALSFIQQALRLASSANEKAQALIAQGRVLALQGENNSAQQMILQAQELVQALMPQPTAQALLADSMLDLGELARHQGYSNHATTYYRQALEFYRAVDNRYNELTCLTNLGLVESDQGNPTTARAYFEQAIQIAHQIGYRLGESRLLNNLGLNAYLSGDLSTADTYYRRALSLCQAIGNRIDEGLILNNLGWNAMVLGDYSAGQQYYEQALALARQLGDKYSEGVIISNLSLLAHQMGEHITGLELGQQALSLARSTGDKITAAEALTHQGHCLAALNQYDEAARVYQEAYDIYQQHEQPDRLLEIMAGQARLFVEQEEPGQALKLVNHIMDGLKPSLLDNAEDGARIYLTCYQVLSAADDPRSFSLLADAHQLIQNRASQIADANRRNSYLEKVAANRELVEYFSSASESRHEIGTNNTTRY